ncbi:MAG: ATP-binding protein [bacterium]
MWKKFNGYQQFLKHARLYFKSFGFKILVFIGFMLIFLIGVNTWYNIFVQEEQLIEEVLRWADNIAQTVKYSTRIHMLENRKEKVQETIHYIVEKTEGIEGIRLYDKKGTIRKTTIQAERGQIVERSADQCLICHDRDTPYKECQFERHTRITQSESGDHRVVSLSHVIFNEDRCSVKCHQYHPADQKVLGVFEVIMSLKDLDEKIARNRGRLILISILFFTFIMGSLGFMFFHLFIRPVNMLLQGIQRLSLGDFKAEVPVFSDDEFGRISQSFNKMVEKLKKETAYHNLLLYDSTLSENPEDDPALRTKKEFGHNGNNGNNGSKSSFEEIYARIQDETYMKLVRSVKLASLGQLSAGIAHEINNPLTAVLSYSTLLQEKLTTPKEKKWLDTIVDETKRCRNIVSGLLEYARQSAPEKTSTQINDIVERAIFLLENKESFHNITIIKRLDHDLPKVKIDRGQIYQVVTNLLINAADAIEGSGTLTVKSGIHTIKSKVAEDRHFVEISVTDTGCGIPEHHMERLFDPFFTTKGPNLGTGLGLSICYGIIKRHNGNIAVRSEIGKGSTFIIHFPIEKENKNE